MQSYNIQVCPEEAVTDRIKEHTLLIRRNVQINDDYWLLETELEGGSCAMTPGQFFHILCPPGPGKPPYLRRPMSIFKYSVKQKKVIFLYKVKGVGTRGLSNLKSGSSLNALGPLGCGFNIPRNSKSMLITARGVGLATLAPLVREATRKGISVTAFLSYKGENSCIAQNEFKENGADVIVVTDEKGDSEVASLKKKIKDKHRALKFDFLATCGSNRLLRMSKELCNDWCIQGQVALESRMGCGIGMCFACVVPTLGSGGREEFKRVCLEGPVFNVNEVDAW